MLLAILFSYLEWHYFLDKVGGEIFSKNFEESATNIERFIVKYESLVEKRKALIEELNQGAVFYRAQYQEAKIVVNVSTDRMKMRNLQIFHRRLLIQAYQSFDARVSKMKKMLDQVKLKFSPVPAPAEDNQDSNVADMDMSDSDQELGRLDKPYSTKHIPLSSHRL